MMRPGFHVVGAFFGLALSLLFIAALVVLFVHLMRGSRNVEPFTGPGGPYGRPGTAPAPSTALALLDDRFARGEIEAEDYRVRRALLMGQEAPAPRGVPPEQPPAAHSGPAGDAGRSA